jgi:hypothetical protein
MTTPQEVINKLEDQTVNALEAFEYISIMCTDASMVGMMIFSFLSLRCEMFVSMGTVNARKEFRKGNPQELVDALGAIGAVDDDSHAIMAMVLTKELVLKAIKQYGQVGGPVTTVTTTAPVQNAHQKAKANR